MKKYNYAKINIALNIVNKSKPQNLHDLDMVNITIQLKDEVKANFKKDGNEIIIECNHPQVPLDQQNLVYKVIEKYKRIFNLQFSCHIQIKKCIPVQSGMAGGSGNAAAMLDLLDKFFKTKMTVLQKMRFLESITSDGPYMLLSTPCRVKGKGEQVIPIESKLKGKILVIKPKSGCETKKVYEQLDYKNLIHPNLNKVEFALKQNNYPLLAKHVDNSLLISACKINNEIEDIINRLRTCGFEIVSLTGSGSTCFALSKEKFPYKTAKKVFKKENYELCEVYSIRK